MISAPGSPPALRSGSRRIDMPGGVRFPAVMPTVYEDDVGDLRRGDRGCRDRVDHARRSARATGAFEGLTRRLSAVRASRWRPDLVGVPLGSSHRTRAAQGLRSLPRSRALRVGALGRSSHRSRLQGVRRSFGSHEVTLTLAAPLARVYRPVISSDASTAFQGPWVRYGEARWWRTDRRRRAD